MPQWRALSRLGGAALICANQKACRNQPSLPDRATTGGLSGCVTPLDLPGISEVTATEPPDGLRHSATASLRHYKQQPCSPWPHSQAAVSERGAPALPPREGTRPASKGDAAPIHVQGSSHQFSAGLSTMRDADVQGGRSRFLEDRVPTSGSEPDWTIEHARPGLPCCMERGSRVDETPRASASIKASRAASGKTRTSYPPNSSATCSRRFTCPASASPP